MRTFARVFTLVSLLVGLSFVFAAGPSFAEDVEKKDPKDDAPARMDMTRVRYLNAPKKAVAHIVVPELVRGGSAGLVIAAPDSDHGYTAVVRVRPNGTLRTRLIYWTNVSSTDVSCNFKKVWSASGNYIDISVPRSCLPEIDSAPLYMRAITGAGKDYAPPAWHLAQG